MGKYDALGVFLRRWAIRNNGDLIELSFTQIESTIRSILPKAALKQEWWSGGMNDRNALPCQVWMTSGFQATLLPDERVQFCRLTAKAKLIRATSFDVPERQQR